MKDRTSFVIITMFGDTIVSVKDVRVRADARIYVKINVDASSNSESYEYEWVGDENGIVGFTYELLAEADPLMLRRENDVIFVGPWRLRVIGQDETGFYAVRDSEYL